MAGNFFTVPVQVIEEIASQTQFVDAVLGYLVLRKSAQGGKELCTAGAPSIAKSLGVTRYKADEILKLLRSVKWGDGPEDCVITTPETWNKATGDKVPEIIRRYPVKVLPACGEEQIALPNTFVDGLEGYEEYSPVRQLRELDPKADRLDVVRLLLKLYQHQSLVDYGGVDPKVIYRGWQDQGSVSPGYQEHFARPVALGYLGGDFSAGDNLHYWLAQPREGCQASPSLLLHIGGTEARFWKLLGHLQKLRLFYEVAVVFDADPLQSLSAEPCYPLYTFDRQAREEQAELGLGGLALKIQDYAAETGFLRRKHLEDLPAAIDLHTKEPVAGLFLFAAPNQTARLITILRLRFRAHTQDTGEGIERERGKIEKWTRCFSTPARRMAV